MINSEYKIVLAIVAAIVGLFGYIPYIRDIYRGKTKPHIFSWFIWGTLEGIAFIAQLAKGGGAGAWVTGLAAFITFSIALSCLHQKDRDIKLFDWLALGGALIGIVLWVSTKNPLHAVICVCVSDGLGFVPTFRKAYFKPNEETLIEYSMSAVKWLIAIFALKSINLTTVLYPASLILSNTIFVSMVMVRRNKIFKI
ncbi:MAG TPA: hypothetical protein VL306_01295 [Methylomirabilota bacterium]|nr:hypothetical protein [Methylomirabilota bacterium]